MKQSGSVRRGSTLPWMEEPEAIITAENVQFKCPQCDKTEQVIYVGGPRSGLMKCANCGKVLWTGKSAAAIV